MGLRPAAVGRMCGALGIPCWDGRHFHCILHPDRHPSATVIRSEQTGWFLYHDWHCKVGREWLVLPDVRAASAGRMDISSAEKATWKLIRLAEAGLQSPQPMARVALPATVSPSAAHVYERLLFALGCRWNYTLPA